MIPWYPTALDNLELARCKQPVWTWGQICGSEPVPHGHQLPPLPPDVRPVLGEPGWYKVQLPPFSGRELQPWSEKAGAQRSDLEPYLKLLQSAPPDARLWYTDGSATDVQNPARARAGAAVVFPVEGLAWLARVSGAQTAGRAEMVAGSKAAERARSVMTEQEFQNQYPGRVPPDQLVSICTDYKFLVDKFQAQRDMPLNEVGRTAHPDVMAGVRLPPWAQFVWLKGHLGIQGNEIVDGMSKKAADLPLVQQPGRPGDVMDYGAPMTGGYLKKALRAMLPGRVPQYDVKAKNCHPAISTLSLPPHRYCTLQQLKRGVLNMAGFTHWAVTKPEPCSFCATATHSTSVQGTLAQCNGAGPAAWRQQYFQLFPTDWSVASWFANAGRDPRRRFVRTLAPDALMAYLKAKNMCVPNVQAAWKAMHKKWLPFWITAKQHLMGGARPGAGSSPQGARTAAVRKSQGRQLKFRRKLMALPEVSGELSNTDQHDAISNFCSRRTRCLYTHTHHELFVAHV